MNEKESEDEPMYDEEIPCKDAEILREIILNTGSLWAIAAYSYNLGRLQSTPKI